ncbi:MAG: hypothetical protein CR993_05825 [Rhodobacterales bacterium]|nr:MAG: hypothetical protein CR993_05825 [Rhodobacterales bacterium]
MKIAPNQRQELDFLRDTLDNLGKTAGRDSRQTFRELRYRLDSWAARVAVIGQVKAGKSTFLNAFLHNHDFLPSDVNPWTSVVTNIRINLPNDPISGGNFKFFAERDWNEIVAGESKIRKLTEQLLPGFDTALLRRQSEEMRTRAEAQLGMNFTKLLGQTHEYDYVTSDLLKAYVCAGPGTTVHGANVETIGRYSTLTKVANLYMRLPEFQVPTIITDTPGVNDPFLVRDEFTCRSLDKSDVFVVVLSAHQPLTDVDVALIRILAKQDYKDVLIFINRIDELDDYDTDVPRVLEDVSLRLHRAIPDMEFSIVVGSGYMADLVMQTGEEAEAEREALDDVRLARYLKTRYGHVPAERDDRLWLASGIDAVKAEISDVIDNGVGRQQLAQIGSDIRAELEGVLFVNRRERETLRTQIAHINGEVALLAVEEMQEQIDDIKKFQSDLEQHVDMAEGQIDKLVNKAWARLEGRLLSTIETFVDDQKEAFEEHIFANTVRGAAKKSLNVDLLPLQSAMEEEVSKAWNTSRSGTDVILNNCLVACRNMLKDKFDEEGESITLDNLPHDSFVSTLTLAKRSLQVEMMSKRSWAFWRKPEFDVNKMVAALRIIAAEELRPAMEKILAAFNEAQVERASAGTDRIRVVLRMSDTSLNERIRSLKKEMIEYQKVATDPDFRQSVVMRVQSQMEVIERRLINLSAIESSLMRSSIERAA